MDEREIRRRTALLRTGLSPGDLAQAWDVSTAFVARLLNGKSRSLRYELQFARLTGERHEDLWPPPRDNLGRIKILPKEPTRRRR